MSGHTSVGEAAHLQRPGARGRGRPRADDLLPFLESLSEDAPAHGYDDLVDRAREHGATQAALARLERARGLALAVRGASVRRRRREAELVSLVDTACDLLRAPALDDTLRLIARRARMLAGMDLAYVYLLPHDGAPRAAASGGTTLLSGEARLLAEDPRLEGVVLPNGPVWTSDHTGDPLAAHSPAVDEAIRAEGLHAVLAVPVHVEGARSGGLYVAERQVHHFTPEEIALVSSLADLAAAALGDALRCERDRAERAGVERALLEARAAAEGTHRAGHAQRELLGMVLDGIGLPELLERAGRELGGPVAVHDASGAPLSRSEGSAVPDSPELERAYLRTRETGRPLPLACGTWVAPLRGPGGHLGWLLSAPQSGADPGDLLTAVAGVVSALLLTHRDRGADDDHLLDDLLDGAGTERAGRYARSLAARLNRPHVLLAARAAEPGTDPAFAVTFARRRGGLAAPGHDPVALLLPGDDPGEAARAAAAELDGILQAPVTVGAVGPVRTPEELASRYREAVHCLEALVALGGTGGGAGPRDLGFVGTLLGGGYEVPAFVEDVLGPVLDYDTRRRTDLLETMEVYFRCAESPTRAAEVLYVHPNTVSRRLERITKLLGPDWQSPDRVLELRLALRLHRTRRGLDAATA